jgi:hypothetical protein
MKDKKLQIGIEEIRKITMTSDEKKRVFEYVLNSNISSQEQPIRSPWFIYSFISRIQKNHLAYYVIVPLIIILTSGGVALASEDSLPSSILYPIKVSVVEPILGTLTFSPKARAKYEIYLATERLIEAETLASQGKLDKITEKKLNNLLYNHTIALNKAIDKASQTESADQVNEIVTSFQAGMNAHARVLDIINKEERNTSDNQDLNVQISNTARINAESIKNLVKNKENKNKNKEEDGNNSSEYKRKKDSVKLLIDSTTANLNNTNIENNKSDVKQTIINDTHKTLNEAKQLLDEANKKEKEGDGNDAYKTLLDSESSIKEADIFLKAGLNLEEKNYEHPNN